MYHAVNIITIWITPMAGFMDPDRKQNIATDPLNDHGIVFSAIIT